MDTYPTAASALHLRILVFEDVPGIWTARSLEHDIVAESRSIEMAVQAVLRIMRAHADFDRRHNRAPLSSFPAAPQMYWNAFARGTPLPWVSQLSHALRGLPARVSAAVVSQRPHAARLEAAGRLRAADPPAATIGMRL